MKKMQKMKKTKKIEKNDEKGKKNENTWIQTQNPLRFPRFSVVVVTSFVKILADFHEMCLFPEGKSTTRFGRVSVFQKESDNFHWT